jgi:hypothetical protein
MTFRLAAVNQILDPWLYIILRKEMLIRVHKFYRKIRYGDDDVSSTRSNANECSSGSARSNMRSQSPSLKQKRILKKMDSADSNASSTVYVQK